MFPLSRAARSDMPDRTIETNAVERDPEHSGSRSPARGCRRGLDRGSAAAPPVSGKRIRALRGEPGSVVRLVVGEHVDGHGAFTGRAPESMLFDGAPVSCFDGDHLEGSAVATSELECDHDRDPAQTVGVSNHGFERTARNAGNADLEGRRRELCRQRSRRDGAPGQSLRGSALFPMVDGSRQECTAGGRSCPRACRTEIRRRARPRSAIRWGGTDLTQGGIGVLSFGEVSEADDPAE
jgi:hypothetical protein